MSMESTEVGRRTFLKSMAGAGLAAASGLAAAQKIEGFKPVSYTHLTLPTNNPWCRSRWSPYH